MLKIFIVITFALFLLIFNIYISYLSGSNISLYISIILSFTILILAFKPRSILSRLIKRNYSIKPKTGQSIREYWVGVAIIWTISAIACVLLTTTIHSYFDEFPPEFYGAVAYFIAPLFAMFFLLKSFIALINAARKKKWEINKDLKFGELMRYESYLEIEINQIDSFLLHLSSSLEDPDFANNILKFNESINKYEVNETNIDVLFDGDVTNITYTIYVDDFEMARIYFYSYSEEIINRINEELDSLSYEYKML